MSDYQGGFGRGPSIYGSDTSNTFTRTRMAGTELQKRLLQGTYERKTEEKVAEMIGDMRYPPSRSEDLNRALQSSLEEPIRAAVSGLTGLLRGRPTPGSSASSIPWNFKFGANFLPSGSSDISTNFSTAGMNGPSFTPATLNFLR